MPRPEGSARGRRFWTMLALACLLAAASSLPASLAWAHGDEESAESYLLVQQALGHLVHDTGSAGIMLATEKIDDALRATDQEGVNVVEVQQAKVALETAQLEQGRVLLQKSISRAISELKPATGEETGTTVVLSPLPVRGNLARGQWSALFLSVLLLVLGAGLAYRFRPQDNVHELRQRLDPLARVRPAAQSDAVSEDES